MKADDTEGLSKQYYDDPSFFVDIYNVGRGFIRCANENNNRPHITSTLELKMWRILEENLIPINPAGIFYNSESYLIQWTFEYDVYSELKIGQVFFYWRGSTAKKGLSPLPENFDNDTSVVVRLVQWSEPAVFFHIFPKPIVVLDAKFDCFNPDSPHLFLIRGEQQNELHLIEVPFLKKNFRSRGVFLVVIPSKSSIFRWKGSKIAAELELTVKMLNFRDILMDYVKSWSNFQVLEVEEGDSSYFFEGDDSEYFHVKVDCNFSPKLYYLSTITGEFSAVEVEYPLRKENSVAAFPFLQSHLSTSDETGLFLLDNNHEIWVVLDASKPSHFEDLSKLGMETATNYAQLREKSLGETVPVRLVKSDTDLIDFTNIFPYWS